MSRRVIVYSVIAAASVLLIATRRHSVWFVDVVSHIIENIAQTPWALILALLFLVLTAAAGALATLVGMREAKEMRTSRRRKGAHARLMTALRRLGP